MTQIRNKEGPEFIFSQDQFKKNILYDNKSDNETKHGFPN